LEALTVRAPNHERATTLLAAIASDSTQAAGTAKDRATFDSLGPDEQRALLRRVTVVDGVPPAQDSRAQLERALMSAHETRFVPVVADLVEGWWWPRVLRAIQTKEPVAASELRAIIDDARRTLTDHSLPIRDLVDLEHEQGPIGVPPSAKFVTRLHAIELSDRRIGRAVDDFLRASAHRSYWLRTTLVLPQELGRYDESLVVEWDDRCDRAFEPIDETSTSAEKVKAGRAIFDELTLDIQRPLRDAVREPFVQRGSLHVLAHRERLAWHPDEAEPLRDALSKTGTS
jgi:hypothetical protein